MEIKMKLNSVSRVNFGYDKKYSRQIKNSLEKEKIKNPKISATCDYLIETNHCGDFFEDLLEKSMRSGKDPRVSFFALSVLRDLRVFFATYYDFFNSNFVHRERMAKIYADEAERETNPYLKNAKMLLSKSLSDAGHIAEAHNVVYQDADLKSQEVSENKVSKSEENSLLTKYIPSESSPKGFSDVVGLDDIKLRFREEIITPVLNPEQAKIDFLEYGIKPPRGFIFYGPPGCGKTFITKALAAESKLEMYSMDVSKIGSSYVNKTANNLEEAFKFLKDRARNSQKPVLLFMDEVDSLAAKRNFSSGQGEDEKAVSTLLKLVEAARDNNIIIIAATNRFNDLDEAFKARFDGQVYFPLPDNEARIALLKAQLSSRKKGVNLANSNEELQKLSDMLSGFSNRSIVFIVDEASKIARRKLFRSDISFEDFAQAIEKTGLQKSNEKDYKKTDYNPRKLGFN